MTRSARQLWFTNHVANPVLRPVLRGPLGRRLGRHMAVLHYRGRRTGEDHEVVVQYAGDDHAAWVLVGQPERKRWWRNLAEPAPVDVWLAGQARHGTATVVHGEDPGFAAGWSAYARAFPAVRTLIGPAVLVRVDLDGASPAAAGTRAAAGEGEAVR